MADAVLASTIASVALARVTSALADIREIQTYSSGITPHARAVRELEFAAELLALISDATPAEKVVAPARPPAAVSVPIWPAQTLSDPPPPVMAAADPIPVPDHPVSTEF